LNDAGHAYRLLTRAPWPRTVLDHPIASLVSGPVYIRAVSGKTIASALSGESSDAALIAGCLVDALDRPIFRDGREAATLLTELDAPGLMACVLRGLEAIGPTYAFSDARAWHRLLVRGARDPVNVHDAIVLGGCVDVALGSMRRECASRPDRYYGLPMGELVDAHWMAFRAARAVVVEMMK
jgi:hypothetical protein